jgi:transcriptional regulator with XRE-family HTH domain
MDLGFKLSALRKDKGLTIKRTAEEIGVNHHSLGNYESGRRNPDLETLVKIAKYYGVSTDFLLDNTKKGKEKEEKKVEYGEYIDLFDKKTVPVIDVYFASTTGEFDKKRIEDVTVLPKEINADYCVVAKNDLMAPTIEKGDIVAISRTKWETSKRRIILFDIDGKKIFRYLFTEIVTEIFPTNEKTSYLKLVVNLEDEKPIIIREDPKEFIKKSFVGAVTAIIKKR